MVNRPPETPDSTAAPSAQSLAGPSLPSPAVDRDVLLALLDREIEAAHEDGVRGGWTAYAVAAAMGALVWALLAELGANYPEPTAFCAALLCTCCLLDAGASVRQFVVGSGSAREARFLWFGRLMSRRGMVAAQGMRDLALAVVAILLLVNASAVTIALAVAYFGLAGVAQLALALLLPKLARFPMPDPEHARPTIPVIASVASLALGGALIYQLSPTIPWASPAAAVPLVKLGGGTAVALYLAVRLARVGPDAGLVDALSEIRCQLALGQIDAAVAARATDVVLRGLRAADVLQPHLVRVHGLLQSARAVITECSHALDELESRAAHGVAATPRSSVDRLAQERCADRAEHVSELVTAARQTAATIEGLSRLMGMFCEASRRETVPIVMNVGTAIDQTQLALDALEHRSAFGISGPAEATRGTAPALEVQRSLAAPDAAATAASSGQPRSPTR